MSSQTQGTRPRILVVEDDADLLRMLSRMLSGVGDVVLATDGMDAWSMLKAGPLPDLIITDLMMPRMDGLSLARQLRTDARLSKIPLVILTAKTGAGDVIAGINAGARHYVTKPFKADDLLGKVKKALGRAA